MIDVAGLRRSIKGFLPETEDDDDWGHQLAAEFRSELEVEDSYSLKKSDAKFASERLSDKFFEACPGLVGKITREICYYSRQPYPSFAFATACAVVGGLKSSYQRTKIMPTSAAQYFFCLAPAGRGKDFARAQMVNVMIRSNTDRYLTEDFSSLQGIWEVMANCAGVQIGLQDEAHHFFANIERSDQAYLRNLKPFFLKMYSAQDKAVFKSGKTKGLQGKLDNMNFPSLSYCGFGVPNGIEDAFSLEELTNGFFSRFLIFRDKRDVIPFSIDGHREVPKRFEFESDPEWEHLTETAQRFELLKRTHVMCPEDIPFELVPHTNEGLLDYQTYSHLVAERRNAVKESLGEIDIFNRAEEIAKRISLAISSNEIGSYECLWAMNLVERAFPAIQLIATEAQMGQEALNAERVFEIIQEAGAEGIARKQLYQRAQFIKRNRKRVLDETIEELVLEERVKKVKIKGQKSLGGPSPIRFFAS